MPQESSLRPKRTHYFKMASSVFTIRNHYKKLFGGFFLFILAGGLEMKAVSCVGETEDWPLIQKLIPNILCGSQKNTYWTRWWSSESLRTENARKQQVKMPSGILQSFSKSPFLGDARTYQMPLFISPWITDENQTTMYGISTDPLERMKLASSSKTPLLQPNSMTQTRRTCLITRLERSVLDDFSKQTFSQTSLYS